MKKPDIIRTNLHQANRLYSAYTDIVDIYEVLYGGPTNCTGIPEYHAARKCVKELYNHIKEIESKL